MYFQHVKEDQSWATGWTVRALHFDPSRGKRFAFLHNIPISFAAQLALYAVSIAESFLMDKAAGLILTTLLHLSPRLRMQVVTHRVSHMPSY